MNVLLDFEVSKRPAAHAVLNGAVVALHAQGGLERDDRVAVARALLSLAVAMMMADGAEAPEVAHEAVRTSLASRYRFGVDSEVPS